MILCRLPQNALVGLLRVLDLPTGRQNLGVLHNPSRGFAMQPLCCESSGHFD